MRSYSNDYFLLLFRLFLIMKNIFTRRKAHFIAVYLSLKCPYLTDVHNFSMYNLLDNSYILNNIGSMIKSAIQIGAVN